MAKRYGFDTFIGFGKEATWGTPVARTEFGEINSESGGHVPGRTEVPSWRSRIARAYYDIGTKSLKSYRMPLQYEGLLLALRSLMWGYSGTLQTTGRYQHTFTIGTTKASPLTIEGANSEANAILYRGSFLRRGQIAFAAGGAGQFDFDFVGLGETTSTKTAVPTLPDITTLLVKPAAVTVSLDSTASPVNEISIACESGIDEGNVKIQGSANIIEPELTGTAMVTANLTRDWNAGDMYAKLLSGATVQIDVACVGPTLAGDTYRLDILIPKAVLLSGPPAHSGKGLAQETLAFGAIDDATHSGMKITIQNSQAVLT